MASGVPIMTTGLSLYWFTLSWPITLAIVGISTSIAIVLSYAVISLGQGRPLTTPQLVEDSLGQTGKKLLALALVVCAAIWSSIHLAFITRAVAAIVNTDQFLLVGAVLALTVIAIARQAVRVLIITGSLAFICCICGYFNLVLPNAHNFIPVSDIPVNFGYTSLATLFMFIVFNLPTLTIQARSPQDRYNTTLLLYLVCIPLNITLGWFLALQLGVHTIPQLAVSSHPFLATWSQIALILSGFNGLIANAMAGTLCLRDLFEDLKKHSLLSATLIVGTSFCIFSFGVENRLFVLLDFAAIGICAILGCVLSSLANKKLNLQQLHQKEAFTSIGVACAAGGIALVLGGAAALTSILTAGLLSLTLSYLRNR